MARPRARILGNLESVYRNAYDRAKAAGDARRMADLDSAYQREQLLLEVLLDIRDAMTAPRKGQGRRQGSMDTVAALDTIRRITKLR